MGQVPPRSPGSITATVRPAARVGTVTPIPALPPPRMKTSYVSVAMVDLRQIALCGRSAVQLMVPRHRSGVDLAVAPGAGQALNQCAFGRRGTTHLAVNICSSS